MQPLNVVTPPESIREAAQSLVSALAEYSSVLFTGPVPRRTAHPHCQEPCRIAILDMEAASISDVQHFSHEFPEATIVCTHRWQTKTCGRRP